MNLLLWVLLGLLGGFVTTPIYGEVEDVKSYLASGVGGALLGGLIANYLFDVGYAGFSGVGLIFALCGAAILLFIRRTILSPGDSPIHSRKGGISHA